METKFFRERRWIGTEMEINTFHSLPRCIPLSYTAVEPPVVAHHHLGDTIH